MTKKRLGVSKNRKKSWKKFSDVEDIKYFLEEEVKDEIQGGSARNKSNSELFFVDKTIKSETVETKAECHWRNKVLRCHQILQSSSKVPPPIKPNSQKLKKTVKDKSTEKKRVTKTNIQEETSKVQPIETGKYDIWETKETSISNGLLDVDMEDYYKTQIRKKARKAPPLYYAKPSVLPAIEFPKPGASYNPTFEDHQSLLDEANKVELKKIKEETKLKRALDNKFPLVAQAPTQETWLKEMSQGIVGDEAAESDEGDIDCTAPLSINPPVRADKRKPANKRRKEKAQKVAAMEVELKKRDKIKENEIFRIHSLTTEVMTEKYDQQAKLLRRRIRKKSRAHLPATLSKYKYEAPDLEVNLSSELTGSLRTLKAEGSIFTDRFKSFQRRNIIPCTIKQKKPKAKYPHKTFVKNGFQVL